MENGKENENLTIVMMIILDNLHKTIYKAVLKSSLFLQNPILQDLFEGLIVGEVREFII